jgi:hypothetical protein
MQRLSTWLALRCKESMFQAFIGAYDELEATSAVRALCGVESRRELDTDPTAAERCHSLIRKPYNAYLTERSINV